MDFCVLFWMMASALLVHGIVPTPSRCTVNGTTITCTHNSIKMPEADRMVHWQTPLSVPPPNGYPVAIFFQGSFFGPETTWKAHQGMIFGAWYQTHVVKSLLDAGFVVITPAAPDDLFWQTNIPPWDVHWANCSDDRFMREIFAAIETSQLFGHCDPSSMFATGISSGGYMTSRVAVEYPERWRAVVIESGSYMICGGPVCAVPGVTECVNDGLPFNHPPTLFLHGLIDPVVPYWSMELYLKALENLGTPSQKVTCDTCTHQWIPEAPGAVLPWFLKYADWSYKGPGKCAPQK